MSWDIQRKDYTVFRRNPILNSVIELRFHPVLEVTQDKGKLSRFQDAVRAQFPVFVEQKSQNVAIEIPNNVQITDEMRYSFSTVDGSQSISITQTNLALTTVKHVDKEQIKNAFDLALSNLQSEYGAYLPTRLGVRYTNLINKAEIEADLNRALSWDELVTNYFFRLPDNLDAIGTVVRSQIQSSMAGQGSGNLSLQYGVNSLNQDTGEIDAFVVDIDRYIENPAIDGIVDLIDGFALDIFSIFEDVAGDALKEWMSE